MVRYEPWLLLPAGVPLVLCERFPLWAQVAALAWIVALWLARRVVKGRWTASTVLDVPVVALLLTVPAAAYVAIDRYAALSRAESLVFAMALAYALANAVHTPHRAWSAATWLLVAGLGLAAIGLVSVDWADKFPVLAPVLARLPRLIVDVPHPTLRAAGVHPNSLAALLVLFLPLATTCLLWPAGSRGGKDGQDVTPPRWIRPIAILSLIVLPPLLILTQSRGAWLALIVAAVLLVALHRRRLRLLTAAAAAGGVMAVLALGPGSLVARLGDPVPASERASAPASAVDPATSADPSAAGAVPAAATARSRAQLWRDALALLAQRPGTGVGLNTFPLVFGQKPEYQGRYVYQGYAHAHNTLLQGALDYGVPGFVALVGLYVALAWAAWRLHRRCIDTPLDTLVVGLGVALAAHATHGLFDALAVGAKPGFVPWAFAGTLAGMRHYAHRWVERAGEETRVKRDSRSSRDGSSDPDPLAADTPRATEFARPLCSRTLFSRTRFAFTCPHPEARP